MLDKLIIHLKNIIFFKAVIYLVLAIILFIVMPILQQGLERSKARQQESQFLLDSAMTKLESIIDFEDKILHTDKKYQDLVNKVHAACSQRINLINNMSLLSKKHSLAESIKIKISRKSNEEHITRNSGNIQLHYYNAVIKFTAPNYHSLLSIIQEISSLLPPGSEIMTTNITTLDVLTPKMINKLTTKQSPDLLSVLISVRLKEIAYGK